MSRIAGTAAQALAPLLLAALVLPARSSPLTEHRLPGPGGSSVKLQVLSVAPGQARLQVLYPRALLGQRAATTSLQELAQTPALRSAQTRWRHLWSAGFSSYRGDVPVGLLIAGRQVYSAVDASPARTAAAACPVAAQAKFRYAGILCVPGGGANWKILPTADYQPGVCNQAVQSGPLLVEPGGVLGICDPALAAADGRVDRPLPRTAVCVDAQENLHLVHSEATTLHALARWMLGAPLKCQVALNLSGDVQAGAYRLPTYRALRPEPLGGVTAPLASALLLEAVR